MLLYFSINNLLTANVRLVPISAAEADTVSGLFNFAFIVAVLAGQAVIKHIDDHFFLGADGEI